MEYHYNQEKDRLDSLAYNPCYFEAEVRGRNTDRTLMLWSPSSNRGNMATIAGKFMKEDEELENTRIIGEKAMREWLTGGKDSITIMGIDVPASHLLKYFTAEDSAVNRRPYVAGDLSRFKEAIQKNDMQILSAALASYSASLPEADVVRYAPDIQPQQTDKYFQDLLTDKEPMKETIPIKEEETEEEMEFH